MYPSQVARSFSHHQLHKDHNVLSLRISTPSPATRTPQLPCSFPVSVPQVPLRAALVATVNRFKTEELQRYTGRTWFCASCNIRKVVPARKHSSVAREKLSSDATYAARLVGPKQKPYPFLALPHQIRRHKRTSNAQIQHRHH
jgi:hypothetical protein